MEKLDLTRPFRLRNSTCPYCGRDLMREYRDRDHVIGENFVPKGSLRGCWNLILNVCRKCNNAKSALEDDISAVTLQPDPTGAFADDSELVRAEAHRKGAGSISRKTGKRVLDSVERQELEYGMLGGGLTIKVGTVAPPQVDEERVIRLAAYHTAAFVYFLSYDSKTRQGGDIPGVGRVLNVAVRSDWGNVLQRRFGELVSEWKIAMLLESASGYFKMAIRQSDGKRLWSWAYEWNRNHRLIGFFGEESEYSDVRAKLPTLDLIDLGSHGEARFRGRLENPLDPMDDILFKFPDPEPAS